MDDLSGDSAEDTRSPCVRAFVRNFEQLDSSLGSGNDSRPPIMPKSKVARLRENLRKPSDFVKRHDSDDGSQNNEVQRPDNGNNGDADNGTECIVSVAKLKESLQKSAGDKRVAPWGFGGTGRSAREPKKPFQNSNSDGEIAEDRSHGDNSKRKTNNSFKIAKTNLLEPFTKPVEVDAGTNGENSGRCDSLPTKLSQSDVILNRSSSRDAVEKPRVVPKVLPKPVIRKSKPSIKSRVVISDERTETVNEQKSQSFDDGPDLVPENSSSRSLDPLNAGVSCPVPAPRTVIGASRAVSDEMDETNNLGGTDEHLSPPHGADNGEKITLSEDEDYGETDILMVKEDDEVHDTNIFCSNADDSMSEDIQIKDPPTHNSNSSSDATATDTITSDDEEAAKDDESMATSGNDVVESSSSDNPIPSSEAAGLLTEAHADYSSSRSFSDSNRTDFVETRSSDETIFHDCMGSDFLSDIQEFYSLTAEEVEYAALSEIVCSKICEKEEDGVRWLLSPPVESFRAAIDYVGSLFDEEIFSSVVSKKNNVSSVDESSFLSCDSLRETLLDRATKKSERLTQLKQRLDAILMKHEQMDNKLKSIVKMKIEAKHFCKYCSVIEDLDKVTHLLLMLSSRLANTDTSLDQVSFSENEQLKIQLIAKRENLIVKFDEAVSLKESIDHRRRRLTDLLKQSLPPNEFSDYQLLVKMKCQLKLLKQSIDDRLALSIDQIKVLVDLIERKTSARYC